MFDTGINKEELERLAYLSEECGEVVQAVSKVIRHGYLSTHPNGGPNNRRLLEAEIADVVKAILLMIKKSDVRIDIAALLSDGYMKYMYYQDETE